MIKQQNVFVTRTFVSMYSHNLNLNFNLFLKTSCYAYYSTKVVVLKLKVYRITN